jgi:hypothetical protein
MKTSLIAAALLLACAPAAAHDTWFDLQPRAAGAAVLLTLGTGDIFPKQQSRVPPRQLAGSGCLGDGVPAEALQPADGSASVLRTPLAADQGGSCWAELLPTDIELDDATVEIYLKEIAPSPAMRERWAALKARGVRWRERYAKSARIEVPGRGAAAASAQPVAGLGLDLRIENPERPLRVGQPIRFQLLRDGQPLAGQALELLNELSPVGLWRSTDAQGRLEVTLPLAARWMLRGTELRPAGTDGWDSRFVTLTFEVAR